MELVFVDTAILAIPNFAIAEAVAHDIFSRVIRLQDILGVSWVSLVLSDDIDVDLWGNNFGPDFEEISAFLEIMNLQHVFTARDVHKTYQTIISRARRTSDLPGFEPRDLTDCTMEPVIPEEIQSHVLKMLTTRSMVSVAAFGTFSERWNLVAALPQAGLFDVSVQATVNAVGGPRATTLGVLPAKIQKVIRCISSLDDINSPGQAERVWMAAESASDLHLAITLAALRVRREMNLPAAMKDLLEFSIGESFLETLQKNQCFRAEKFGLNTLEKCAHLVANSGQLDVGTLGRPDPIERVFDKASARRVHLTTVKEGLRLMFWQCAQSIEFANVGVKKELEITHGRRGGAITCDLSRILA